MPLRNQPYQHRNGDTTVFWYSACVARPVDRKERAINAKAMASLDKEWNKLISQKCWDYAPVREWREVAAEADKQGIKAHVGRIFDICVEKNSELPEGDPNRKYKGRVVFEGCHVKDEHNNWAIFSEITSCPATMEAGKAADAFGLLPGHAIEVADGESAYTQAKLEGPPTWCACQRIVGRLNGMESMLIPLFALFWHCMDILMLVGFGNNIANVP